MRLNFSLSQAEARLNRSADGKGGVHLRKSHTRFWKWRMQITLSNFIKAHVQSIRARTDLKQITPMSPPGLHRFNPHWPQQNGSRITALLTDSQSKPRSIHVTMMCNFWEAHFSNLLFWLDNVFICIRLSIRWKDYHHYHYHQETILLFLHSTWSYRQKIWAQLSIMSGNRGKRLASVATQRFQKVPATIPKIFQHNTL